MNKMINAYGKIPKAYNGKINFANINAKLL